MSLAGYGEMSDRVLHDPHSVMSYCSVRGEYHTVRDIHDSHSVIGYCSVRGE